MSNEDFDEYSHINISNLSEDNFNNNTLNNRVSNEDSLSIFDKGYQLRPIEAFLINKLLPFSVKMESEDNYKRYLVMKDDSTNPYKNRKKRKKKKLQKDDNSSLSSFDDGNFLINRLPSKVVNDKTINIIHQGKRERLFMQLRCEKVIEKIKKHKYESIFYSSASLSDFLITHGIKRNQLAEKAGKNSKIHVSLKKIYKKVNEKIYRSLYELGNDLRRIWSYFFKQFADVPQLYSIIYTMSEFCEELIKEIDLLPNIKLNQKFCLSLNANKFNPINGIKNNSINQNIVLKRRPLFKTTVVNFPNKFSNNDIQMLTMEEKSFLVDNIQNLQQEYLANIVNMLNGSVQNQDENNNYFEFNIESLSPLKQRQLYNYVIRCLRTRPINNDQVRNVQLNNDYEEKNELEQIRQLKNDLGFSDSLPYQIVQKQNISKQVNDIDLQESSDYSF